MPEQQGGACIVRHRERERQAEGDVRDSKEKLEQERAASKDCRLSKRFNSKSAENNKHHNSDGDQREHPVRPVNRHQRFERQQAAFAGAAERAQNMKGAGEVHRRNRLPEAARQIGAGERGVVGADPAAEGNLDDYRRESQGGGYTDFLCIFTNNVPELRKGKPNQKHERRHAPEQMGGDDRRLEQHRHRPFAERCLEHDQRDDRRSEPGRAPDLPGNDCNEKNQQAQRCREVAVTHFLPGFGVRAAVGHRLRHRLAVAERPIGTAQARIGEPHIRADDDDDERESCSRSDQRAIHAHPIREYLSSRCRSFSSFAGSGSRG